jgi:hypothetical protein
MFKEWGAMQSIVGLGTDIIFLEDEQFTQSVNVILPDGHHKELPIPFASEAGFLCAKGRSLHSEKRTRDAYDIYLVVTQSSDYSRLIERSRQLMENNIFEISMKSIMREFRNGAAARNVVQYLRDTAGVTESIVSVVGRMDEFFSAITNP